MFDDTRDWLYQHKQPEGHQPSFKTWEKIFFGVGITSLVFTFTLAWIWGPAAYGCSLLFSAATILPVGLPRMFRSLR